MLGITKKGFLILSIIGIIYLAVLLIALFTIPFNPENFFLRIAGLWGYITLAAAIIMTAFAKEIYKNLGRPFIKIHHLFAFSGIILITLHPVLSAVSSGTLSVFIPDFSSWYRFWIFAGRPALIILYIALIAALFRKKIRSWRIIHAFMTLMLVLGFFHAVLLGSDFKNPAMLFIYSSIFGLVMTAFVIKRVQLYKAVRKNNSK